MLILRYDKYEIIQLIFNREIDEKMRKKFNLQEIIDVIGAETFALGKLGKAPSDFVIENISTDTRERLDNAIFIALIGEKFDAHNFLEEAIQQGNKVLVISNRELAKKWSEKITVLLVNNTTAALLDIAGLYRDKLKTEVISLTGSVGKTSTKDCIAQALGSSAEVYKTAKNLNNNFGVSYTLLDIPENIDFAIIEVGMDGKGQIEECAKAIKADLSLITNIGTSHIERLGSRKDILQAKSEILTDAKSEAPLLINAEDPYLLTLADEVKSERAVIFLDTNGLSQGIRSVLAEDADLPIEANENSINGLADVAFECGRLLDKQAKKFGKNISGTRYKLKNLKIEAGGSSFEIYKKTGGSSDGFKLLIEIKVPTLGPQVTENILFAVAVADIYGRDLEKVKYSFADGLNISSGRQEISKIKNHNLLIDDSYNASPESLKTAFILVDKLRETSDYKKIIAVIGGVNELGSYRKQLHADIAAALANSKINEVYLIGPEAEHMSKIITDKSPEKVAKVFTSNEQIEEHLLNQDIKDSIILFKGSRGFALDEVANAFKNN